MKDLPAIDLARIRIAALFLSAVAVMLFGEAAYGERLPPSGWSLNNHLKNAEEVEIKLSIPIDLGSKEVKVLRKSENLMWFDQSDKFLVVDASSGYYVIPIRIIEWIRFPEPPEE